MTERLSDDMVLPFQVGESAVRGRIVRLGDAVDTILSRHPFPPEVNGFVGEAAALVSLLGASLKFAGKLILQLQGDGPVSMVVADFSANGALRATATTSLTDQEPGGNSVPSLALLGKGHLAMTVDQGADMERFQGVVPLEGESLSAAILTYFDQSEQIPTAVALAVGRLSTPDGKDMWRAGGIMVQFMPGEGGTRERGEACILSEDDEESWNRAKILMDSVQADELLDPQITPETLLYRLYHEDGVRVFDPQAVRAECTCSRQKVASVLSQYSREDLASMVEDGAIEASCDFCRTTYRFEVNEAGASPD
ncbi:MAG: Hsp33 family molecular chaperone [Parvularcula sp.]